MAEQEESSLEVRDNALHPFASVGGNPQGSNPWHAQVLNQQLNAQLHIHLPQSDYEEARRVEYEAEAHHQRVLREVEEHSNEQTRIILRNVEFYANQQHEARVAVLRGRYEMQDHLLRTELQEREQQMLYAERQVAFQENRLQTVLDENATEMHQRHHQQLQYLNVEFRSRLESIKQGHQFAMLDEEMLASNEIDELSRQNNELQEQLDQAEALARDLLKQGQPQGKAEGSEATRAKDTGHSGPPPAANAESKTKVTEIPDFMKDLFEAGPASPKEGAKGGSAQAEASSPTSDKDKTAVLLEALQAITSKGDEKPKTKEADSVKVPDFPNPETYRSWKMQLEKP